MRLRLLHLALATALVGAVASSVRAAGTPPGRIVSINVCSDQLLMLLADPGRIASVSFLAADPSSSAMANEARSRGYRLNHGRVEEILPLKPDLVLAGTYAARNTVQLLRRLGYRVVDLPLATGLDDVAKQIRIVAAAIGEKARGERLIARYDAHMAAIPAPPPEPRPVAALFESNGITAGRGTLPGAVMRRAGFDNLAARLHVGGVGKVPLETVVAARPDALILGRLDANYPSLAARSLHHPALRNAVPPGAVTTVRDQLWACPIPSVADAVAALTKFRLGLGHRKKQAGD